MLDLKAFKKNTEISFYSMTHLTSDFGIKSYFHIGSLDFIF